MRLANIIEKLKSTPKKIITFIRPHLVTILLFILLVFSSTLLFVDRQTQLAKIAGLVTSNQNLSIKADDSEKKIGELLNEDQYKKNQELVAQMNEINSVFKKAVEVYEDLIDLKTKTSKTEKLDTLFAKILSLLSERNYTEANTQLSSLSQQVQTESDKANSASSSAQNVPVNNTPPSSGYRKQSVQISSGAFVVDIISADLTSTKVIVDTASDSTCGNDCPVLSLADYVSRSGAYAGVNGTYFCPASYPTCAGKTNSFDLLVMNKNKTYFNSDNNVYSSNPAAIFGAGWARFVSAAREWGRDTSVDAVISNYPLLVQGGNKVFSGDGDAKHTSKGGRSFIGASGSTVYIGVVRNATVAQSAEVLQTLGIKDAMNLDDGGSTALWSGGYKVGPGRALPNAVLFVSR